MLLLELLKNNANINVTITLDDLRTYSSELIQQTKKQLEADVIAQQCESYLTRQETCDFLKVDQSTIFRWARRGYLIPIEVGGRRLYRLSEIKKIMEGKK